MAEYIDLNGVRMWYERQGAGDPFVMLHPGGADSRPFGPNLRDFASRFTVFLPEQRGHGHTRDVPGGFTYELTADDTIEFIERVVGGPACSRSTGVCRTASWRSFPARRTACWSRSRRSAIRS